MPQEDNYYIGWRDELPRAHRTLIRRCLIGLVVILPLLCLVVVLQQKPFNDHQFRLGNVQEFTGVYHSEPVPILEILEGDLPEGIANEALLVGFGKFGAQATMDALEEQAGSLDNRTIKLAGTLIFGDGHAVLELTKGEESLIEHIGPSQVDLTLASLPEQVELRGELLDPKCFFGVMKPGEGKIHKSCAIRCLSGGVPPVFRTSAGSNEYYIVMDHNGELINEELLPYVGRDINITGTARSIGAWNVIELDARQLPAFLTDRGSLCSSTVQLITS